MTNSSFLKRTIFALFALSAVLFVSCDDDFNLLGADVVGGDVHSDMIPDSVKVVAYDRAAGAVQSNNMLQNQLGIYKSPIFGTTVSHFVTQVVMASENPTLYSPIIDSVYLYIPYHSEKVSVDEDGKGTYEWGDNYNTYIFGDTDATFGLDIYRNGYYLRDSDPAAGDNVQRYYSDDRQMVENAKVESFYSNADFKFDIAEQPIIAKLADGTEKVVERKEPGMLIPLDAARMTEIFFSDANKGNLVNNSIFKNYFRGLYFKVTPKDKAVMNIPRFSEGTITFKIHDYESKTEGNVIGPDMSKPRTSKTITFNLKGNTINFFDNEYDPGYISNLNTLDDPNNGDGRLYLNGGAGSMAIINFDQTEINELTAAYEASGKNLLINEANLVFHLDLDKGNDIGKALVAQRVYLYDLTTRRPIIDYSMDGTKSIVNPKRDKYIYGGILDTLKDKNGNVVLDANNKVADVRYKIRLTNHIKNIIEGDSTNVKLGLVVTDNISITTNNRLKTPFTDGTDDVKEIPYASVQSNLGTVLYGSNVPLSDEKKRIKLEIYYSKPKE